MISFKKFLFAISSIGLLTPASSGLLSCSSIFKHVEKPPDTHNVELDTNKLKLKVNGRQSVNIKNFKTLSDLGLTSIAVLDIKDKNIVTSDYSNNVSDSITFKGISEGKSSATISFTNIITQQIAIANLDIVVGDEAKFSVVYDKEIGKDEKNPISFKNNDTVVLGKIDSKYWKNMQDKDKKNLIPSISGEKEVENYIHFSIDENGQIIATHIKDQHTTLKSSKFHIQITSSDTTSHISEKGHDFWYEEKHDNLQLTFKDSKLTPFKYCGDDKSKSIKCHVDLQVLNDEAWTQLTSNTEANINKDLDEIKNKITVPENQKDILDKDSLKFDNFDATKGLFGLNFSVSEKSFPEFTISINFLFHIYDSQSKITKQTISGKTTFSLNSYRHGVKLLDVDNKNEVNTDMFSDGTNNFNFVADFDKESNKDGSFHQNETNKLFSEFSGQITTLEYDQPTKELENNGYSYVEENGSVILTDDSFKALGTLNPGQNITGKELNDFNQKIIKLSSSNIEKKLGFNLSARLTRNSPNEAYTLNFTCNGGFKQQDGDTTNIPGGDVYIVSKFKDSQNNYEILYTHFVWKDCNIPNPSSTKADDVYMLSHFMSMPISTDEQKSDSVVPNSQKAISNEDISNGVIPGDYDEESGSLFFLAYNDIKFSVPDSSRKFGDEKDPYRGYIEITGAKEDKIYENYVKLEDVTKPGSDYPVTPIVEPKPVKDEKTGKWYVSFSIPGQKDNDVKQGIIEINMIVAIPGQDEYSSSKTYTYAAYAGKGKSAGSFNIEDFLEIRKDSVHRTSLYIAKSASDREFYLGLTKNDSTGGKDNPTLSRVYVEPGFSYNGNKGVLSLDVPPDKREKGVVPHQVKNITFGGDVNVTGSYVIANTYESGISGFLTFCGKVNFTSNASYTGSQDNDQDIATASSGVIITGSSRTESPKLNPLNPTYISKYGIRFADDVNIKVKKDPDLNRTKDNLEVIGLTSIMYSGNITFDKNVNIDYGDSGIKEVGVYVYENLAVDLNNRQNEQALNNQWIKGGLKITGEDSETPDHSIYRGIVVDKTSTNLVSKVSEDSQPNHASVKIDGDNKSDCLIPLSYVEEANQSQKKVGSSLITSSLDKTVDSSILYKGYLFNLIINCQYKNNSNKNNDLYVFLANGKYSYDTSKLRDLYTITYKDKDGKSIDFDYNNKIDLLSQFKEPTFL